MTTSDITSLEVPRMGDVPPEGLRANIATKLWYEHTEKMARTLAPPQPHYELARKSPAGKTSGWEFTISHPDPAEIEKLAHKWDEEFPAPQPVAKA